MILSASALASCENTILPVIWSNIFTWIRYVHAAFAATRLRADETISSLNYMNASYFDLRDSHPLT
jgi:hypothetical protein